MQRTMTLDDEHLIAKILAGQEEFFEVLVRRHLPMVQSIALARMANASEVDDITQEVFLKAFRSLSSLRQRDRIAPWLAAITRNVATSLGRNYQRFHGLDDSKGLVNPQSPPPDHERQEILRAIRSEVMALDDTAREVVLLYYFAGQVLTPRSRFMVTTARFHGRSAPRFCCRSAHHSQTDSFASKGWRPDPMSLKQRTSMDFGAYRLPIWAVPSSWARPVPFYCPWPPSGARCWIPTAIPSSVREFDRHTTPANLVRPTWIRTWGYS